MKIELILALVFTFSSPSSAQTPELAFAVASSQVLGIHPQSVDLFSPQKVFLDGGEGGTGVRGGGDSDLIRVDQVRDGLLTARTRLTSVLGTGDWVGYATDILPQDPVGMLNRTKIFLQEKCWNGGKLEEAIIAHDAPMVCVSLTLNPSSYLPLWKEVLITQIGDSRVRTLIDSDIDASERTDQKVSLESFYFLKEIERVYHLSVPATLDGINCLEFTADGTNLISPSALDLETLRRHPDGRSILKSEGGYVVCRD